MPLTLEDIARISGVSRSTVSRVVNGGDKVNPQTRERVLEVIRQWNYQPNVAARRLAAGRSDTLGLLIPAGAGAAFEDPYFSQVIRGVAAACSRRDYALTLWLTDPEREPRVLRRLAANNLVDGVVVSYTLADDPIVGELRRGNLPFVLIGHAPDPAINAVALDNVEAARVAVHYLLERGYRRIGIIMGAPNQIDAQDRLRGFTEVLKQAGVFDPTLLAEGDFSEESGYAAMRLLLPRRPEAVFAANDLMAVGAYRAIQEAGLSIPADVAMVGFDDVPMAAQLHPPLTTIRQPMYTMGQLAVERLLEILRDPRQSPRQILLPPELVVRQSA